MGMLITDQRERVHINHGWAQFLQDNTTECYHCGKWFGPTEDDLIFITDHGHPNVMCGTCAEKLALPFLAEIPPGDGITVSNQSVSN